MTWPHWVSVASVALCFAAGAVNAVVAWRLGVQRGRELQLRDDRADIERAAIAQARAEQLAAEHRRAEVAWRRLVRFGRSRSRR